MPIAGAAISSSRVAIAKRPTRVSRNQETAIRATSAAIQSQVFVVCRGMPERPPAPLVSSCQFLTPWSTTNSTASVIIVAASPPARATAMPTTAPSTVATSTPDGGRGDRCRGGRRRARTAGSAATSPSSPPGWRRARCRTPRAGRRRGARTTGCPVSPVKACRPSTRIEVDEQLLHEQVARRPAGGRVDGGPTPSTTNRRPTRRPIALAAPLTGRSFARSRTHSLTLAPRVRTVNRPWAGR